jgi:hypothetical protein
MQSLWLISCSPTACLSQTLITLFLVTKWDAICSSVEERSFGMMIVGAGDESILPDQ